jgi:hypothetical protein
MSEKRVVPVTPTEEMRQAGAQAYDEAALYGVGSPAPAVAVFTAMVAAAPPTEDGEALRAVLATFPEDAALERYRKALRNLADDMAADAEYQARENIVGNLATWVEYLAGQAVDQLLRGNVEQMRRYLSCDGYTGRGNDDSAGFRQREPHEWHPIIRGRLHEADPIALRRAIVEAHRDLIAEQRIMDLEDQVRSLVDQVSRREVRIEALISELREYRR